MMLAILGAGTVDAVDQEKAPAKTGKTTTIRLLEGKLTLALPDDFVRDSKSEGKETIAHFNQRDSSAWGAVVRGTRGITPEKLPGYLESKVAEYSRWFEKDLKLPDEFEGRWLRREMVTIRGRPWADMRFVPAKKGVKDYSQAPLYTRFLGTSYQGQLIEISFTANLETDPAIKTKIDRIMESVGLEK